MDICTIADFRNALYNASQLLRTLRDIEYETETITCTKYFAECSATHNDRRVTIYAPTTLHSMALAKEASALLGRCHGELGSLDILAEELHCMSAEPHLCSLIVEPQPEGAPLSEPLHTHTVGHLMEGLNALINKLKHYDISHNRLKVDNIFVGNDHTWRTDHNYYVTKGYGHDEASIAHFRALIEEYALPDLELNETLSPYTTADYGSLPRPIVSRRRRVTTPRGIGFEDECGNLVIEDIYLSATDFFEDRAIVVTHDHRHGLIDKRGRYIIDAEYDDIEFDTDDGTSRVRLGDKYAIFDYLGEQISDWQEEA